MPRAWARVSIRQLLDHTSGLPDYTESAGFRHQFETDPKGYMSPRRVMSWVAHEPLRFAPGSRYQYSNTDNIVVGPIAERVTGRSYGSLLRARIFKPLGLRHTSFPTHVALRRAYLHGYTTSPGAPPQDVSEALNPSGAWASGAIVSTPLDLGAFIRGYIGGRLFSSSARRQQRRFVAGGASGPPGPGVNAAGLGAVSLPLALRQLYGHTGNFPGYVQWAAASNDGFASSLLFPIPAGPSISAITASPARAASTTRSRLSSSRSRSSRTPPPTVDRPHPRTVVMTQNDAGHHKRASPDRAPRAHSAPLRGSRDAQAEAQRSRMSDSGRVRAGRMPCVAGNVAGRCPRGGTGALLSRAFNRPSSFAGVPAIYATVRRGGAYSARTKIPAGRKPGRYRLTGRCASGSLGVVAHGHVLSQ
jgi:hypothetical protein